MSSKIPLTPPEELCPWNFSLAAIRMVQFPSRVKHLMIDVINNRGLLLLIWCFAHSHWYVVARAIQLKRSEWFTIAVQEETQLILCKNVPSLLYWGKKGHFWNILFTDILLCSRRGRHSDLWTRDGGNWNRFSNPSPTGTTMYSKDKVLVWIEQDEDNKSAQPPVSELCEGISDGPTQRCAQSALWQISCNIQKLPKCLKLNQIAWTTRTQLNSLILNLRKIKKWQNFWLGRRLTCTVVVVLHASGQSAWICLFLFMAHMHHGLACYDPA